jgi:two-component system LytT family response regulator
LLKQNVLVVDDEYLARQSVKIMLEKQNGVGEVFEAKNSSEALKVFGDQNPDIVFMDIQMPGISGIELAKQLPNHCHIVFATAYDKFAVEAFELNAVDYLLKPFDDDRFTQAWMKIQDKSKDNSRENIDFHQVEKSIENLSDTQEKIYRKRLVIKDPGRIRLVDVDSIQYISGAGNYAELHLADCNEVLHRETLTMLEKQLDPELFVRIHRSTIVRRDSVIELRPNERGDYSIVLKCGKVLTLSRTHKDKLDMLLS